jgi:hypothetical protein
MHCEEFNGSIFSCQPCMPMQSAILAPRVHVPRVEGPRVHSLMTACGQGDASQYTFHTTLEDLHVSLVATHAAHVAKAAFAWSHSTEVSLPESYSTNFSVRFGWVS